MIQTPGKHSPTIKNRSSKHLHMLTKRGMRALNNWHKKCGIPEYKEPYHKKDEKKNSKKQEDGQN